MFERLLKPYLTVETGEAYQPIRLTYNLYQHDLLVKTLNQLKCCEKTSTANTWHWLWRDECHDISFESLDSFKRKPDHPVRLGTLSLRDEKFYINLTSFKRACLAVPFFNTAIHHDHAEVDHADFINKVFGLDERLPHGFTELFKEEELTQLIEHRVSDYHQVEHQCEMANSAEEALSILSDYTQKESAKRLPYAERYAFQPDKSTDPDVMFLGFY